LGDFTVAANTHVSGEYTLAVNYDGTTSNLYVNGDLISQTTPSPSISAGVKEFILGKEFDGYVKNFKFWNYAKPFLSTIIAFHYGSFDTVYGDADVTEAANNGHIFDDTPSGTYTWGTLGSPSTASNQTTYTWTPALTVIAKVLMVAGGGAGNAIGTGWYYGGGGGAGGVLYNSDVSLSGTKTIEVGNGGTNRTINGSNTTFTGLTTAIGGGSGDANGGSGGGQSYNGTKGLGTSGQGYDGGSQSPATADEAGGGGGGSGGVGADATILGSELGDGRGGNGGIGTNYSSIFGTTYGDSGWFGGGGGGGTIRTSIGGDGGQGGGGAGYKNYVSATSGTKHTGGGGGGGGWTSNTSVGEGGSGIVIIRYTP